MDGWGISNVIADCEEMVNLSRTMMFSATPANVLRNALAVYRNRSCGIFTNAGIQQLPPVPVPNYDLMDDKVIKT
jgi:hypothetical protein